MGFHSGELCEQICLLLKALADPNGGDAPPGVQILSFSCSLGVGAPPQENPGSATEIKTDRPT